MADQPVDHVGICRYREPSTAMLLPVEPALVPVVTLVPLVGPLAWVLTRFTMNTSCVFALDMPEKRTSCAPADEAAAAAPPVEFGQSSACAVAAASARV